MAELELRIVDGPHEGLHCVTIEEPPADSPTGLVPSYLFVLDDEITPVHETAHVPPGADDAEDHTLDPDPWVYDLKAETVHAALPEYVWHRPPSR